MKLRTILLVLSILAFLSASIAGYLYHSSLKETEFKEAERQVAVQAERIKNSLSAYLSENLKSVKALAGLQELEQALSGTDETALAKANSLLDHFRESLDADVCYLMDRAGNTVASSNRNAPDSFVGRNFSFRPYWRQAIRGTPVTYMALGVTSGKRGVYYSHPVYRNGRDAPIGVAVIKAPIDPMEAGFRRDFEGIVLLTDPHGVVFLSNRQDWVYHTLWKLSPEEISDIVDSQQFGEWPWEWIGVTAKDEKTVVDSAGNEYLMYRMDLDRYPGWQVIYLHSLPEISKKVSVPFLKVSGPIVLALCVLIGLSVFFLYKKASLDILKRKEAEEALRKSEEQLRGAKEELQRYSRDLERQVGERTREITGILRNTPSVVYIKDKDGRYTLVNSRYEELFGIRNEEVQGKSDHDIFPKEIADQFRGNDLEVFADGHPRQVEERVPQGDGIHIYLSVKFPLYDQDGSVNRVCGISTDITELKKAQDQLRRLSDGIMASQEKERTAVARELHDELGQVLTALRIDSVWLRDRLDGTDEKGAERALMMCALIDNAIDEVRGMATRLRPGVLDDLGLVDALEWFAMDFEKRTGIKCDFSHRDVPDINDTVATAAYRIAQETFTNAARHSSATRVDVSLTAEDGRLSLAVADNGRGFDTKNLLDSRGLGVAGMRERAALVGGALEIHSRPGKGTRVVLHVPLGRASGAAH
ncbi:MAG: PAS domain-containing protein [Deltaproteobacteria bacterium]|nr:PAS domain-containing protein [Deltaproteobacteria bacterium]